MKTIKRWYYKLEQFVLHLDTFPERFANRALKLWDFIKLGWNDNDWDYEYTYELLRYKFKKQEEYFLNSNIAVDNIKSAKIARVLNKSLDRFNGNKFDYYEKYREKHLPFKVDFAFIPAEDPNYRTMIWVYEDSKIPLSTSDLELMQSVSNKAAKYERRMVKKYRKIFYRTMYKHMEELWD